MRGLEKVKMQMTLSFACMNLKKLAVWGAVAFLAKPTLILLKRTHTLI